MDDFVLSNLYESKNEWCGRLLSIFTPLVMEGVQSIFNEAFQLCVENNEVSKYLMTFQNLLCRIPKWNSIIVEEECRRIIEKSGCNYLEDLITCVHVIQLKVLTSIRVGTRQKKIDIIIPKLDGFVHKIYIAVARKLYTNVYLFEKQVSHLEIQKNKREMEKIIQECILNCIRESIPTSEIIRAYLDTSVETEEEIIIEDLQTNEITETTPPSSSSEEKPDTPHEVVPTVKNLDNTPVVSRITFNDIDNVCDENGITQDINVSKTIEDIEKINTERELKQQLEYDDEDEDYGRLKIFDHVELDNVSQLDDATVANAAKSVMLDDPIMLDFEEIGSA